MTTLNEADTCVESISLVEHLERRVALANVRLGDLQIHGVAVWRARNGHLRVNFPGYKLGADWDDAFYVPDELRSQIEADVIAAYKEAKATAKKEETKNSSRGKSPEHGRPRRFKFPYEGL